jgi:GNAT superfamily N-acetyltransferase
MVTILQASSEHQPVVHDLFQEYLEWVCPEILRQFNASFDAQAILIHDMQTLDIFTPPQGQLLLAYVDGQPAGCACMRTIGERMAEIKRMYVRPANRRLGIGRALLDELVRLARAGRNATLRLDSARFMSDAHALYHRSGFVERAPYPESEIPPEFRAHWVFMEMPL